MTKMTYTVALNYVLENCTLPEDVAEKLTNLLEQQEKRATNKKPTAKQIENVAICEAILAVLAECEAKEGMTVTEIVAALAEAGLKDLAPQRVTALVSQMVKDERVKREVIKRKAYFQLP